MSLWQCDHHGGKIYRPHARSRSRSARRMYRERSRRGQQNIGRKKNACFIPAQKFALGEDRKAVTAYTAHPLRPLMREALRYNHYARSQNLRSRQVGQICYRCQTCQACTTCHKCLSCQIKKVGMFCYLSYVAYLICNGVRRGLADFQSYVISVKLTARLPSVRCSLPSRATYGV